VCVRGAVGERGGVEGGGWGGGGVGGGWGGGGGITLDRAAEACNVAASDGDLLPQRVPEDVNHIGSQAPVGNQLTPDEHDDLVERVTRRMGGGGQQS